MDNIERKALELLNEVSLYKCENVDTAPHKDLCTALRRAIEQHEAFRQEVSDACNAVWDLDTFGREQVKKFLSRFIIPKSDPLLEALDEIWQGARSRDAIGLRAALAKRGLEIREKSND